jgi:hypothetical protein
MESVQTHFERYLREQSLESFMRLRDAVIALPGYEPYSNYKLEAHSLLEKTEFDKAVKYLMSKMPGWLLNPGIHKLLSFAFHKLGDEDKAKSEYALARLFLNAILSTGDGSEARPYLVSSVTDEYDVLEHLGRHLQQQTLIERGDKRYDRFDCKDGSQIWFDITVPLTHFGKMAKAMRQ